LRMELYYRFGEASAFDEIEALLEELIDRFGEPPLPVIWLYHLTRLRIFGTMNHFTLLKFGTLSLHAEQQKAKTLEKKTLILPQKVQTPKEIEAFVIEQLRKSFICE